MVFKNVSIHSIFIYIYYLIYYIIINFDNISLGPQKAKHKWIWMKPMIIK